MGLFDQFPYTNFHELNLDWILNILKEIQTTMEEFVSINSLKFADPIQWDITSQYEKNTIVIDPQTGTAYLSTQAVPTGVALSNTDYWTVVFNLGSFVTRASKNFSNRYEEDTTLTATFSTTAGEWLVWGDVLYRAIVNITAGDSYVVGSNIEHITMEDVINYIQNTMIGSLGNLTTSDKSSIVNAINEVLSWINTVAGDRNNLNTTDKTNLVAAINEVLSWINTVAGDRDNLNTTDQTNLVAAINEVLTDIGNEITTRGNADVTINNRITSIDPCEKFRNKTICVIGDSISDYNVLADNWVARLTSFMSTYNCTVNNFSDAGRSFASLKNDLDNSLVTMPVADYYVVFIGTNYDDSWGYTTGSYPLNDAINSVHNAIIAANSQAKLFFLSPIKKWLYTNQVLTPIAFMRSFLEQKMTTLGYTVISGYNLGELSQSTKSYYMADDVHPNANLSQILCDYVLDALVSERSNVIVGCKTSRADSNTLSSTSTITFYYNHNLSVDMSIVAFSFSPTLNDWIDVCDMPTFFDDNPAPTFQASTQNTVVPQYRLYNGKLQAYFFSQPASSFYDYLTFRVTFATSE